MDESSLDSNAPPALRTVAVPSKIKFTYQQKKETVETYAFKIQCNRSELEKVTECLEYFYKVNNTCTFIPYGLKQEDPAQYTKWVRLQNSFLKDSVRIPLFGLSPLVMDLPVKKTKDTFPCAHFLHVFENILAIHGIEETNKTEELGIWFVITDTENEKDARNFLDNKLSSFFMQLTWMIFQSTRTNIFHIRAAAIINKTNQWKPWLGT